MSGFYRRWEPLFAARDLARGPLLVFAPHPDDETIGSGGLILAHRDAGCDLTCAVMTDGSLGDASSAHGAGYIEIRRAECRAAIAALGGGDLRFGTFGDGALPLALETGELEARVADLLAERDWSTVVFPSPYELHPDHRALGLAVLRVAARDASERVWLAAEIGSFMPANLMIEITALGERKDAALRCYASQLEHHDLIAKVQGVDRARSANVDDVSVTRCEAYLRVLPGEVSTFLAESETLLRTTDRMMPPVPWE
ncbi:MAG: PIG-L family deacetylase [Planctomycetes bacterium]|nr:PIG-L family deacetylase [Planctomycetota bacterium]